MLCCASCKPSTSHFEVQSHKPQAHSSAHQRNDGGPPRGSLQLYLNGGPTPSLHRWAPPLRCRCCAALRVRPRPMLQVGGWRRHADLQSATMRSRACKRCSRAGSGALLNPAPHTVRAHHRGYHRGRCSLVRCCGRPLVPLVRSHHTLRDPQQLNCNHTFCKCVTTTGCPPPVAAHPVCGRAYLGVCICAPLG